jgi:hypothetical protein
LFAAGYMGALVQLGAKGAGVNTKPSVTQRVSTPSAPLKPEASTGPVQTATLKPEAPPAPVIATAPPPRAHARSKTSSAAHSTRPGASSSSSSSSSSTPEREPESPPPVLTIRPLSSTEPSTAPLSAATVTVEQQASTGERPSRDAVMQGLAGLRSRLVECAEGRHGLVDTHVTIAPSGRVTYSLIGGDFVGSSQGSCMARALRSATFPPFSGPSLKVLFPYSL